MVTVTRLHAGGRREGKNELGKFSYNGTSFIGLYGVRQQIAIKQLNAAVPQYAFAIYPISFATVHDTALNAIGFTSTIITFK